jgi:preprotein translocase subunit SecG
VALILLQENSMYDLIATLHVIVSIMLILLVLVQDSKGGAGMFAGGSSQSILGATGGATLLSKLSRGAAIVFALTCIMLTIYTSRHGTSVVDGAALPPAPATPPPAATTEAPAAATATETKEAPAAAAPAAKPAAPAAKSEKKPETKKQ